MNMAQGLFPRLWRHARTALESAQEVYILGFRFPESDAHPREQLLRALFNNQIETVRAVLILGADVGGKDTARVVELLSWTLRWPTVVVGTTQLNRSSRRRLEARPLYVEDFLDAWSNAHKIPPVRPGETEPAQ